jgi:hypothetical protein
MFHCINFLYRYGPLVLWDIGQCGSRQRTPISSGSPHPLGTTSMFHTHLLFVHECCWACSWGWVYKVYKIPWNSQYKYNVFKRQWYAYLCVGLRHLSLCEGLFWSLSLCEGLFWSLSLYALCLQYRDKWCITVLKGSMLWDLYYNIPVSRTSWECELLCFCYIT